MQISFSTTHSYTPEWRGNDKLPPLERATTSLELMDVADLLFLLDHFSEAGLEGEVEVKDVEVYQIKQILKACGHLLPKYVKIENLLGDGGVVITIDDVVKFPFFLNLSAELLMKLAEQSSPNDDDEKNSDAPPDLEPAQ